MIIFLLDAHRHLPKTILSFSRVLNMVSSIKAYRMELKMVDAQTFTYKGYQIRSHPYQSKYGYIKAYNTGFNGKIPEGAKCDGRCNKESFFKVHELCRDDGKEYDKARKAIERLINMHLKKMH